ncbi:hypothetical protein EIP91_001366 [Steccherinum ochraceum]|uniref:Uncharacterized protein n=1 Tax=Steccherinum ochraceum TaxID=92696 RepID=A0A4R0RE32_9APHY|nr:hypothetical protein EIP91_001366 [Steccherinum ochraceum]
MVAQTNLSPYNLPSGGNEVDDMSYNPDASADHDNDDFIPDRAEQSQPIGARGSGNHATGRNSGQEDHETSRSEETAGEVNDLIANQFDGEKNVQGRTRGIKGDAYKQERKFDQQMKEAGVDEE